MSLTATPGRTAKGKRNRGHVERLPRRTPPVRRRPQLNTRRQPERDAPSLFRTAADTFTRGVLILAAGFGAFHGYLFLTTSPQFAVEQVRFQGLDRLQREDLLRWTPPVTGQNLYLLDLERLALRLNHHPWIRTASVMRKWPRTLVIQVHERQPYARIELEQDYVMDNFGVLVSVDRPEFAHLPLIKGLEAKGSALGQRVGSEKLLQGLRAIQYLNGLQIFKNNPMVKVRVEGPTRLILSPRNGTPRVRLAADRAPEGFRNFKIISEAVGLRIGDLEHIDISFKNQVVIKPKPGAPRPGGAI